MDNQLKNQLQLRDEYIDAELKIKDQNLEEAFKLRDEEWKQEKENLVKILRQEKMFSCHSSSK